MLQSLHIHNFALIEDLHLDLGEGVTIFTGETGVGLLRPPRNRGLSRRRLVLFCSHAGGPGKAPLHQSHRS